MLWGRTKKNEKNNYGLFPKDDLFAIALEICETLHGKSDYAITCAIFLVEIAMAETNGGKTWDKTHFAGMGITQIDKIGFVDTIKRTSQKKKDEVLEKFGVDLDACDWLELRHNPRLCFLITRLFLLLRPNAIPNTQIERAQYWKKWYNTEAGKGTIEHFTHANINNNFELKA